jgi:hypothetical protein
MVGAGALLILIVVRYVFGYVGGGESATALLVVHERLADRPATRAVLCEEVEKECPRLRYPPGAVYRLISAGLESGEICKVGEAPIRGGSSEVQYRLSERGVDQ